MAILKTPPKACAMCGSQLRAVLQYKVGDGPWLDGRFNRELNRWQIGAQPTLMRWICGEHWLQDKGYTKYKHEYPKYRRTRSQYLGYRPSERKNPPRLMD